MRGGQWIEVPGVLESIPIFVKSGSILPMEQGLQYASEEVDTPMEIKIYPGQDVEFILYEDAGDDYEYEEGMFNQIKLSWEDEEKILRIGSANHDFLQSLCHRQGKVIVGNKEHTFTYTGEEIEICF